MDILPAGIMVAEVVSNKADRKERTDEHTNESKA